MAVTLTAAELATGARIKQAAAELYLPVTVEMVQSYADAPDVIANAAAIRLGGWLVTSQRSSLRSERAGDLEVQHAASLVGALRHSGAQSLLAPYRRRRALTIPGRAATT